MFSTLRSILPVVLLAAIMATACSGHDGGNTPKLKTQNDTLSWAMGQSMAATLQQVSDMGLQLDEDIVRQAIAHTVKGGQSPLNDTAYAMAVEYMTALIQGAQMKQYNDRRGVMDKQQEEYFKQLVAKNPNLKQHPSGFYYEVVKAGKGRNAKYAERVSFDYRSYLMLSGEPYDQTYGKRDPIIHTIGTPMFSGLIEGLQLMNAGSIYRFYFPYQLAFGESGSGDIPGFTPFIYEVELHEIFEN